MKDKLFKRRPQVNWFQLMIDICDPAVGEYYCSHFHQWVQAGVSQNKRAYLALLHVYGHCALRRYRYSGIWCD